MDDKQVSSSQPDLLHNTSSPRPLLSPRSHPLFTAWHPFGTSVFLFYHQPPAHWTEAMGLCSTGYVGV